VYRIIYCLLFLLYICPPLSGQAKDVYCPLSFDSITMDLGSIQEADGTVFHTFRFVNTSSRTIKFGRIAPSCRCLNTIFSQDSFESGESGEIIIGFNPAGMTGKVYRYVDIYEYEKALLVRLSLTADVIPEAQRQDEAFSYRITDHVYATADKLNMGYVPIGGKATGRISVINTSSETVALHICQPEKSYHADFDCPSSLAPGQKASIEISFSIPETSESYGIKKDIVEIWVDRARNSYRLSTSFIGIDHFGKAVHEKPEVMISPSLVALKRNMITRRFEGSFMILNRGNANLHIRSVDTETPANINIGKGDVIPPGQKKKIKAGSLTDQFSVFLITDDPVRPVREIRFQHNH